MRISLSSYAIVLTLMCVADGVITSVGVSSGWYIEANPLMLALMKKGGQPLFLIVKFVVSAICLVFLEKHYRRTGSKCYYNITIGTFIVVYLTGGWVISLF